MPGGCIKQNHIQVSDEEFDELVAEFWRVSYYARFYYRDKVIHTLTKNGIKIHVFGNGWGDFVGNDAANLIWEKEIILLQEKRLRMHIFH